MILILFISAIILDFVFIYICEKKCWDLTLILLIFVVGLIGIMCDALIPCGRSSEAYGFYYKERNRKHAGLEARIEALNKGEEDPYLWDDVKEFNSDLEYAQY